MIGGSNIQARNIFVLTLSFAIHVFLGMSLSMHGGFSNAIVPGESSAQKMFSVTLIKKEGSAMPDTPDAVEFDKHKDELPFNFVDASAPLASMSSLNHPVFEGLIRSEPYYFGTTELTEKPHVLLDVSPILSSGLLGTFPKLAVLRLLINEYGDVDQVVIEEHDLTDPIQQLVIEAFSKAKFEPGKIDDVAVKSRLRIEVSLETTLSAQ